MSPLDIAAVVLLIFAVFVGFGIPFSGVPFLPTRKKWVARALTSAKVGKGDVLVDLGSGSGTVLKLALKQGVKRAIGYEINPALALWTKIRLLPYGKRAEVYTKNFLNVDLPADTTVIYLFGVEKAMPKLTEYIASQASKLGVKELKVVCFGCDLVGYSPAAAMGTDGSSCYVFKNGSASKLPE